MPNRIWMIFVRGSFRTTAWRIKKNTTTRRRDLTTSRAISPNNGQIPPCRTVSME